MVWFGRSFGSGESFWEIAFEEICWSCLNEEITADFGKMNYAARSKCEVENK